MGWVTLELSGRRVSYLPAGEPLPDDAVVPNADRLEDAGLAAHPRARRVVLRVLPSWPFYEWVLHWSDGTDLLALDAKVRGGEAADADFTGALACQVRSITCRHCEAGLRAIVADTAPPVLNDDLQRRLRAHTYVRSCPACGGAAPPQVAELVLTADAHQGQGRSGPA